MEVIPRRFFGLTNLRRERVVRLVDSNMSTGIPLKNKLSSLDVDFLESILEQPTILDTSGCSQIPWNAMVDQDKRGIVSSDVELVDIAHFISETVDLKVRYLVIALVEDMI